MGILSTAFQTGHVGLNVSDLARASRFYQEVFGFTVTNQSSEPGREFVFLNEGETLVLTLWQQSAGEFSAASPGLHHLSFVVPSFDDVESAQKRVTAAGGGLVYDGIALHAENARSGGIFFTDPDGIRLEIFTANVGDDKSAPTAGAPTCGFF